jgi:ABC-2 type transport system permease protein
MLDRVNYVAFITILNKEITRFLRIWPQTLLPPVISMTLYFLIFGKLIGSQISDMSGFSYMQYIAPGLVMMSVVTNAYSNVASSFFGTKFQRNIDEMLIAPVSNLVILVGFVMGGILRGLMIGLLVILIALFFTKLHVYNLFIILSVALLSSLLFSLAGFTNGLMANKFDDVMIIPTFVITPLTYLGGVFYSIHLLSPFWQELSKLNPVLYMVNAFRYGILGLSDVNIMVAMVMIIVFIVALFILNLALMQRGYGLRS